MSVRTGKCLKNRVVTLKNLQMLSVVMPPTVWTMLKLCPDSKPWVTKSLRLLLNRKRQALREGNRSELAKLKKEAKSEIVGAKRSHKEKLERVRKQ